MKIVFSEKEKDVIFLHPKEGEFKTSRSGANIEYSFGFYNEFCLNISNQALGKKDIDDLIDFLKAAKEHLK